MPQVLVVDSGKLVSRELRIPATAPKRRISPRYQQDLVNLQNRARKEIPLADGETRKIVFDI